jgi:hypothetical protein
VLFLGGALQAEEILEIGDRAAKKDVVPYILCTQNPSRPDRN